MRYRLHEKYCSPDSREQHGETSTYIQVYIYNICNISVSISISQPLSLSIYIHLYLDLPRQERERERESERETERERERARVRERHSCMYIYIYIYPHIHVPKQLFRSWLQPVNRPELTCEATREPQTARGPKVLQTLDVLFPSGILGRSLLPGPAQAFVAPVRTCFQAWGCFARSFRFGLEVCEGLFAFGVCRNLFR